MVSITLEILPEIRHFSKAKMYRYHQIGGMVATGDINTTSWFWPFLRYIENIATITLENFTRNLIFPQGPKVVIASIRGTGGAW